MDRVAELVGVYWIRGADGTEHGPHSVETLRAWLADGRITLNSVARSETGADWKPLGTFPELGAHSDAAARPDMIGQKSASPQPPPLPPSSFRPAAKPPLPQARWSLLAIASLVLGLFSFMVIPALPGLVCGLMALSRIRRSSGALKGRAIANIGILLSLAMLILVVSGAFWAMRQHGGFRPQRPAVMTTGCTENLVQLANSIRQYANDHGDILPDATNWCDQVREYVPSMDVYTCPGGNFGRKSNFAMNRKVAGYNQDSVNPSTVLLFESPAGWNATGTKDIAGSAGGMLHVVLLDGQVVRVNLDGLAGLRWEP